MSEYIALLKRELRSIAREKTIMMALVVQLLMATFSSVILQGIVAYYDPASIGWGAGLTISAGFVGDARSPVLTYLDSKRVVVKRFSELTDAEAAFRNGQIDTILFVPESRSNTVNMKLILPRMEAKKLVILLAFDEPLKKYEDYLRQANGIYVNYRDFGDRPYPTYEFLYSVLVPILMLFPALIAGSIVIDSISEEFENKTINTLLSAPVSSRQVFASKVTAAIITAVIQVPIWAGLLRWNGIVIERVGLVLLLAMSFTVFISLGAATIAVFFRDRQRAQFVYSMTLITTGAAGYFLNPSPLELLAKLAAGAPDSGPVAIILYAVLPVAIGLALFFLAERTILAGK